MESSKKCKQAARKSRKLIYLINVRTGVTKGNHQSYHGLEETKSKFKYQKTKLECSSTNP